MNMVETNLIKVTLIAVGLMLAGCPADTPSNPIAGTVTVTTEPGNVVSIGASGTNFKTVGTSGEATFKDLPEGNVDIHVFSSDGYTAISYYDINSDAILAPTFTYTPSTTLSVIDIYVTAINEDGYGFYHLDSGSGGIYGTTKDAYTNIVSFIVDLPTNTVINGTLYAVKQGGASSTAGNVLQGGVTEVLNLGQGSYTTQDFLTFGTSVQASYHAGFSAAVVAPILATVQLVTPPSGMQTYFMLLSGVNIDPYTINGALVFPDTIRSAPLTQFARFQDEGWMVFASGPTGLWVKAGSFTPGDTLNIAATMASIPSVAIGQSGNTISWVESSDNHTFNRITVDDFANEYFWFIHAPSGVNSITLPTVPAGALSPLAVGAAYSLSVASIDSTETYERAAGLSVSANSEGFASPSVSYTR